MCVCVWVCDPPVTHWSALMSHAEHAPVSKLLLAVVVAATFGAVFGGVTHWLDFRLHTIVGQVLLPITIS